MRGNELADIIHGGALTTASTATICSDTGRFIGERRALRRRRTNSLTGDIVNIEFVFYACAGLMTR